MVKKLSKKDFYDIYAKVPRLCIELVLHWKGGIVFTKRNIPPKKGVWHLPGKTMLKGMNLEENIRYVARDELGVEIDEIKFIEVFDWYGSKNTTGQVISLVYQAGISDGQKIQLNKESSAIKVFKNLPENSMEEYKKYLL